MAFHRLYRELTVNRPTQVLFRLTWVIDRFWPKCSLQSADVIHSSSTDQSYYLTFFKLACCTWQLLHALLVLEASSLKIVFDMLNNALF